MIHLHFTYTKDDYIPALRAYLLHKPKFIALFTFVYLLLISLLTVLIGSGNSLGAAWLTITSVLSLLGLLGLLLYALPHQRFQNSYRAIDEYRFHITDQAIIYETEHENGALSWRRCTKLLEAKPFYVLEHDHRRITVIPKRAFKNKEEENAFRAILKNKLKPTLSSKLLKEIDPTPGEGYEPPERMPDWR